MFCSKCGAALAGDAAFCQTCGNRATPAAVVAAPYGAVSPHAGVGAIVYATGVTYAGFWLRFVAFLIDGVIISAGMLVLLVPLFMLIGGATFFSSIARDFEGRPDTAQIGVLISVLVLFGGVALIGQWLYYAYLESGEKQATWGKQALGIYVTDLSGNPITFARASGRYFARLITGMIPLAVGYIMAGFTERRQALHDMIASCLVLKK